MPADIDTVLKFVEDNIIGIEGFSADQNEPVSIKDVDTLLNNSELPRGPADALAFHDFYKLKMAFEDVWEQKFSNKIASLGQDLYVRLILDKDTDPKNKPINSIEDVKRLLEEAKALNHQMIALASVPAAVKRLVPGISIELWSLLEPGKQFDLLQLAARKSLAELSDTYSLPDDVRSKLSNVDDKLKELANPNNNLVVADEIDKIETTVAEYQIVKRFVEGLERTNSGDSHLSEAIQILEGINPPEPEEDPIAAIKQPSVIERLGSSLNDGYAFNVYVEETVNFGVLLQYRQEWDPQAYQVGELVNTIPLAPKEIRKYTKKQTFKESRSRKEINNALSVRKGDTALTNRTDTEIVRRANEKSGFTATASAGGSIGAVNFNGSAELTGNSEEDSQRTRKNFREAVGKSAQELKNEQKLEIELTTSEELEETTTGEISNPNEEIVVTYLFYELQRRYKVQEYLHDATPVILVANHVPNPDEIDEAWLLRHEWILRRVILDDAFLKAFDKLNESRAGKNVTIETLRTNVQTQIRAFEDTKIELQTYVKTRTATERELRGAVESYAEAVNADDDASPFDDFMTALATGGLFSPVQRLLSGDEETPEAAEARQVAVEEALARTDQAINNARTRLAGIATALGQAIDKYTQAIRDRLNCELTLTKLRVHVRDNILYYMQAIWDHEPPDQRYFRLCEIEVPTFGDTEYTLQSTPVLNVLGVNIELEAPFDPDGRPSTTLKEVADLDTVLGYKGNYQIFPMIVDHPITTFMMQDYLDQNENIRDPDQSLITLIQGKSGQRIWREVRNKLIELEVAPEEKNLQTERDNANITQEEFNEAVRALYLELDRKLKELRGELLKGEPSDEIVIPSDMLFIAALPGVHPVLEKFKRDHRGLDVLKVASELEEQQVDLIRRKARLLSNEFADPDVDNYVQVEGAVGPVTPGIPVP